MLKQFYSKNKNNLLLNLSFAVFFSLAGLLILTGYINSGNFKAKAESVTVFDSDSTEASDGCIFLGAYGSYYTDAQAALDRINEIRYEACVEGVPNPNDSSVALTVDDYVPLKWSSSLEKIARLRAAESAFTNCHARLNGSGVFSVYYNGLRSTCEDLAWNFVTTDTMVYAVNMWYSEKSNWLGVCDGSITTSVVTGHYTSMINPKYTYVGLGDFYNSSVGYYNTTAGEFSRTTSSLDTTMLSGAENIIQKLEVDESYIKEYYIEAPELLEIGDDAQLQTIAKVKYDYYTGKMRWIGELSYKSSDSSIINVNSDGKLIAESYGTATISAYSGTTELASVDITVKCKGDCELGDYDENYIVSGNCSICGYASSYKVPSKMNVYWKNLSATDSYYSKSVPKSNPIGSTLECIIYDPDGDDGYNDILVECSNPDLLQVPDTLSFSSSYCKFKVLGTGVVTLTLTTKYNRSLQQSYTITLGDDGTIDISEADITLSYTSDTYTYTGYSIKPTVVASYNGVQLESGTHYSVTYYDNYNPGTATVVITGTGIFTGTAEKNFEILGKSLEDYGSIILDVNSYEYDGTAKTPKVTVKFDSSVVSSKYYTVTYENNTEVGTARVVVTGTDLYRGTISEEFTIAHNIHLFTEWTVSKAADCETIGEQIRNCLYCDYSEKMEIAALGHNFEKTVTEPTCTEKGYTTYTCTRCDDTYTEDETKALDHDYDAVVTKPTCTEEGYTTYTCTRCDDTYTEDKTEALDHDYEAVITEPTCTEEGYTTYTCTRCDDTYTENKTEALDHDYEAVVTEPTCTEKGYTTYTCTRRDDTYTEDETEALGHDYEAVVTEPTCSTKGYITYVCEICSDSYKDSYTATIAHTLVKDAAVAATCTKSGLTAGTHCSVCNEVLTAQKTVAALGHKYTSKVTKPTYTANGYTTYTCSRCGNSYKSNYTNMLTLTKPTVKVANTSTGVKVTWSKTTGATGYIVYRKTAKGTFTAIKTITSGSTVSYVDTTAKAGTTYYYTVRAYAGSNKSNKSSYVTDVSIKYLAQPTVTLTNTSTGVKISWTKSTGAGGYYVYRKAPGDKKWTLINKASNLSYTDTTAKVGTTYYYTVKAYSGKTYSSYVTDKTIKRLTQPVVTLSNVTKGVKISWKKITGATGYIVYRKTASGSWSRIKTITSASTLSYTDTTGKNGTTYYYTVKAYSGSINSSYVTNKSIKYKK
jgi:fibronectin type 3 domain-containing protein